MKKINHTPGPWIVIKDERNFKAKIVAPIKMGQSKDIAEVPYYPRQRALFHNASLISAAPELLAALRRINTQISPEHFGQDIYDQIQKAIKKATASSR